MNKIAIILLGPQGSGKGTQGKILAKKLGLYYWDMGGILRKEAENKTQLGKKIANIINAGLYVDDPTLIKVIKKNLSLLPITKSNGIIFDGVPRRLDQAVYLLDYLKGNNYTPKITVYIELTRNESIKRLLLRKEKENRADDTRELIERRLDQNDQITVPILGFLRKQTDFITVNGQSTINNVSKNIEKKVRTILKHD